MRRQRDPDAQPVQPRLLRPVVGEVDHEGEVVHRRPLPVQPLIARLPERSKSARTRVCPL